MCFFKSILVSILIGLSVVHCKSGLIYNRPDCQWMDPLLSNNDSKPIDKLRREMISTNAQIKAYIITNSDEHCVNSI